MISMGRGYNPTMHMRWGRRNGCRTLARAAGAGRGASSSIGSVRGAHGALQGGSGATERRPRGRRWSGARMRRPASDLAGARLPVAACSRGGLGWPRRRRWASVIVGWLAGSARAGAAVGLVWARPISPGTDASNGMLCYVTVLRSTVELERHLQCSGTTKPHIFHVV